MLIERLDTIDVRCERLEKHMQREQEIVSGHVNTSPWGLDVSLYVYDHLFAYQSRPFQRAHSYYVKTNWANEGWEDRMLSAAMEGRFDDELRGICDLEALKRLLHRTKDDEAPLLTSTVGLNSARLCMADHLGDMMLQRWVSGQKDRKWKSVQCIWDRDDGVAFWLTPPLDTSSEYRPTKSSVRDCCTSIVDLVKVIGGPSIGLEFEVCPLPDSGKDFLRRFEVVCQRELDGVDDERTIRMKEELKRDYRKWRGLKAAIEKHPYWRGWACEDIISGW